MLPADHTWLSVGGWGRVSRSAGLPALLPRLKTQHHLTHPRTLEHDHVREVHAVRCSATHKQRVLFHEAEAGSHFARARHRATPSRGARSVRERAGRSRNAARAREDIERRALAQEQLPRGAAHHRRGTRWCEHVALSHEPLDAAPQLLLKQRRHKRNASEHHATAAARRALDQQHRLLMRVAHDKPPHIKRRRVRGEPLAKNAAPCGRQHVLKGSRWTGRVQLRNHTHVGQPPGCHARRLLDARRCCSSGTRHAQEQHYEKDISVRKDGWAEFPVKKLPFWENCVDFYLRTVRPVVHLRSAATGSPESVSRWQPASIAMASM